MAKPIKLRTDAIKLDTPEEVLPVFTLRGVNIKETLDQYFSNKSEISFQKNSQIPITAPTAIFKVEPQNPTHLTNICVHTDQSANICDWCRLSFSDHACGIPIDYKEEQDLTIFILSGVFCSFQCAYANLKDLVDRQSSSLNPIYQRSECYLIRLFNLIYPGERLIASPEWRLLKENRGTMEKEEYFSGKKFVNVGTIPTSRVHDVYKRV